MAHLASQKSTVGPHIWLRADQSPMRKSSEVWSRDARHFYRIGVIQWNWKWRNLLKFQTFLTHYTVQLYHFLSENVWRVCQVLFKRYKHLKILGLYSFETTSTSVHSNFLAFATFLLKFSAFYCCLNHKTFWS